MSHAMGTSMMQVNADHSPHGPCFLRAPLRKLIWARLCVRLSGEMLGGYLKKLAVCQARVLMSEALLYVCDKRRAQLLREQLKLSALRDAARRYQDIVCASARALKFVADDRDAYVEELDLDWDFSDPGTICDLSRRLDRVASVFHSQPCQTFSGAAFACASKALMESLEPHKELERAVLWLRNLSGSVCEDDVRDCADLLEAAGEVVEYQLRFGISMRVTAVCADGSALKSLASRLREFADALR